MWHSRPAVHADRATRSDGANRGRSRTGQA
ncbi:hypothetical protein [Cupriavidus sp. HMR-1]|nr:hypothetical protein [Cupriavidus sp. HMR-1]